MISTKILEAKAAELKKANKKNKKGFTLVELIVVLVIIAILAAILIPTMSGYISRARKAAAQSSAKTMVTALAAEGADYVSEDNAKLPLTGPSEDSEKFDEGAKKYGASLHTTTQNVSIKDKTKAPAKLDGADKKVIYYTIDSNGALTNLIYQEGNYMVGFDGKKYSTVKAGENWDNGVEISNATETEASSQK